MSRLRKLDNKTDRGLRTTESAGLTIEPYLPETLQAKYVATERRFGSYRRGSHVKSAQGIGCILFVDGRDRAHSSLRATCAHDSRDGGFVKIQTPPSPLLPLSVSRFFLLRPPQFTLIVSNTSTLIVTSFPPPTISLIPILLVSTPFIRISSWSMNHREFSSRVQVATRRRRVSRAHGHLASVEPPFPLIFQPC